MSREDNPPRRRLWPWVLAVAAIAALGLAIGLRRGTPPSVEVARAARKDLVVPILSDGTLEPPSGGELRAPQPATVAEIRVAEGARVPKGTPLLRLDDPELSAHALEARVEVQRLLAERARAAAELEQARRLEAARRKTLESDARLLAEKAFARAAFEADEQALREASDRVRSAQAMLLSLDGSGNARLQLAEASARELERRLSELVPRAPLDGIVYGLPRKVGEAVAAGQVVASVSDPGHARLRARVDQPDLPRIAVGQRLTVTFDGLPGKRWEGRVSQVSPGVREVGGREVGEVLGEISDAAGALPPNASVNVEIVAGEKKGALVVPRGALLGEGAKRSVFVLRDGRAHRQDVSVGLIGINEVEVTAGLSEGDAVLLPGATPLVEGERVAARK